MIDDIASRYGVELPPPDERCDGLCEGMGVYPDMGEGIIDLSVEREIEFKTCETCGGTGKKPPVSDLIGEETK